MCEPARQTSRWRVVKASGMTMDKQHTNELGCPLRDQSGALAVKDFARVLGSLSADLRAAFEKERALMQRELDTFVAANGYRT